MEETKHEVGTYSSSPEIAKLAEALAKAQGAITAASKDRENPYFESKYATLASVWEACRGPLSANGLSVLQPMAAAGTRVTVTTILAHASGEWIRCDLTVTAKGVDAQSIGSAVTYCRRYGLSGMVGVAPDDDDDGNEASQPQQKPKANGKKTEKREPEDVKDPKPTSSEPSRGGMSSTEIGAEILRLKQDAPAVKSPEDWTAWKTRAEKIPPGARPALRDLFNKLADQFEPKEQGAA